MSPAVGPYSPVRRVGDWVITSGQVALATADGRHVGHGGGWDHRRTPSGHGQRVGRVGRSGCDLGRCGQDHVYLIDMDDFADMNEVWVTYFRENRPTRSAVCVAGLPLGARIEVEAWAYAPAAAR